MGRRTPATPFEQFCARLARTCLGSVRTEPLNAQSVGAPQAWLTPARPEDIAHARALCQEYRVALVLEGGVRSTTPTQTTLWVLPQAEGAMFSLVDIENGIWKADGSCTIAQLEETGVFTGMALGPELTLAQWFAWPETVRRAPSLGTPAAIQLVERIEVLLADGTLEVLGPFGLTSQAPLRSLTMQRLVPKLFELAGSDAALRCARLTPWPTRYRLDALMTTVAQEPNLAQLFYGHQGQLAWVQTLWLKRPGAARGTEDSSQESTSASQVEVGENAQTEAEAATASHLDQELKHILDPFKIFGSNS